MTKTILVVDDDPAVLQSYGRLLRRLGHRVLLSEDSDKVGSDPESVREIDLLILDQRMPRTSGLALLASLRARDGQGRRGPAVILISAVLSRELRTEAARLGVVEVIEKPVDNAHLLATVRAALEGPGQERAVEPPSAGRR
jgi:DNA-binding response OmpR family regulator